MAKSPFAPMLDQLAQDPAYHAQLERMRFIYQVGDLLEKLKMTRKSYADALGVKPAYVTKVLNADANFSLETMMKLAMPLGRKLRLQMVPLESNWDIYAVCTAAVAGHELPDWGDKEDYSEVGTSPTERDTELEVA